MNPFCRKFRKFLFLHLGQFSGIFRHVKILRGGRGVVRRPGSPENIGGKGPGFDSRRGEPAQHILLDVDDDEDDEHEEDHKDDEDEDDEEDKNEDKDEFQDGKG